MQARTLTVVTVLVDLKNAFLTLLRDDRKNSALLMGYTDFILLNVEDVQWVAIDVINSLLRHIESDPSFEARFLENSQHFLFHLQAFKLEAEWSMLEELARGGRPDASQRVGPDRWLAFARRGRST